MKRILFCLLFSLLAAAVSAQKVWFDGHWYMDATVNDSVQGRFIFDTGADGLILDSLYFEQSGLKIKQLGYSSVGGAGNSRQRVRLIVEPLMFRFDTLAAPLQFTPIVQFKPMFGRYVDGLVGWQYFEERIVKFDYERHYISILQPSDLEALEGFTKIPLTLRNGRFFFTAAAVMPSGKQIEGEFILDMGSGGALSYTSAAAVKYNLAGEGTQAEYHASWGGLGGESKGRFFRAKSLAVGEFTLDAPILNYSLDKAGALSSSAYLGLLGNEVLKHFDVVIDFRTSTLYLRPNDSYNAPWTQGSIGFRAVDRTDICDGLVVRTIYKNSNVETAGLRNNDIITHVDGVQVQGMTEGEAQKLLDQAQGEIVLTVVRGGKKLEIRFIRGGIPAL